MKYEYNQSRFIEVSNIFLHKYVYHKRDLIRDRVVSKGIYISQKGT